MMQYIVDRNLMSKAGFVFASLIWTETLSIKGLDHDFRVLAVMFTRSLDPLHDVLCLCSRECCQFAP